LEQKRRGGRKGSGGRETSEGLGRVHKSRKGRGGKEEEEERRGEARGVSFCSYLL